MDSAALEAARAVLSQHDEGGGVTIAALWALPPLQVAVRVTLEEVELEGARPAGPAEATLRCALPARYPAAAPTLSVVCPELTRRDQVSVRCRGPCRLRPAS